VIYLGAGAQACPLEIYNKSRFLAPKTIWNLQSAGIHNPDLGISHKSASVAHFSHFFLEMHK
jgi:hypothetical protein